MKALADRDKVRLRPHFKTHQSLEIGSWFREYGVSVCAVSSPSMARKFVDGGWVDVLIALPANLGSSADYNELSKKAKLGLIGDSVELIRGVDSSLEHDVDFWIEVDAGYGRTGVKWDDKEKLMAVKNAIDVSQHINLRGVLIHAGNSYDCRGIAEIESLAAVVKKRVLVSNETVGGEISYGDTPTCGIGCDTSAYDEIRPGNFVFYDLVQEEIGSCKREDIAISLACPVIGVYPEKGAVVVHGGAVHLSKDTMNDHFGIAFQIEESGRWVEVGKVTKISQEHGTIEGDVARVKMGEVVHILPVHSCLLVDCMGDLMIVDA